MLRKLFERCLNGEIVPEEWRTSHITPIHKKGTKADPKNNRAIADIPTIGRIYSRILRDQIEDNIKIRKPKEKAGFRVAQSTLDNIFTLKIVAETRVQRHREIHIATIDLEKAYDSIPIQRLWKEMKNLDITPTIIQATKNIMNEILQVLNQETK